MMADHLSRRQNAISQDPAVKTELNAYLQTLTVPAAAAALIILLLLERSSS